MRSLTALAAALALGTAAHADDTEAFLGEDNWSGLMTYWAVKDGTIIGNSGTDGLGCSTPSCAAKRSTATSS
jgi:hypothetical protein